MTPEQLTEEKFESNVKKYKAELENLEKRYNGMLTPKDIVREASSSRSPLHNWFDWSDNEASEKWRLHQARVLMGKIKVTIMFEGTTKEYRKYLNVNVKGEQGRFYVPTSNILKNPDMKEQVLKKALQEVTYWERAYADYQELEDIFKGITKTKKKLRRVLVTTQQ